MSSSPVQSGRASIASFWTIAAFGSSQILRLASNVFLAHTLFPEAFALTVLAGTIVAGLQMFSDIGLLPTLVRSARGEDPVFRSTAWTLGVIRGAATWLVTIVIAVPVGHFYDPQLTPLLPAAGAISFITSLSSSSLAAMHRHMQLRGITLLDFGSTVFGLIVTCVWARIHPTPWAMMGGGIVGAALRAAGTWMLIPGYRDRFVLEPAAMREIVRFGRWILLSTMITFVAMQADRLLLGKLLTLEQVGIYSIAFALAGVPRELVLRLASTVQYPALSRCVRERPEGLGESLTRTRVPLAWVAVWLLLSLGLGAQGFFALLYDARYHDAAWIAQWLSVPIFISTVSQTSNYALLALGDSRAMAIANGTRAVTLVAAGLVGHMLFDLPGFIVGMGFSALAGICVQWVCLRRHGLELVRPEASFIFGFVGLLGAPILVAEQFPVLGEWRGVDLTLAVMAALVVLPVGVVAALRIWPMVFSRSAGAGAAGPADVPAGNEPVSAVAK